MKKGKTEELSSDRIRVCPLTDEEMEALIARTEDEGLRAAYTEMLDGSRADPENRLFCTAWKITSADAPQTVIGDLCFKGAPDEYETVEIGYGVEPEYRNQGYATEAVGLLTAWAFAQKGVSFVSAQADAENTASLRVLEKSGFVRDDTAYVKEHEEGCVLWSLEGPLPPVLAFCMCIGLCLGSAIGVFAHNLGIGFPIGILGGATLGAILDSRNRDARKKLKERLRERSAPSANE